MPYHTDLTLPGHTIVDLRSRREIERCDLTVFRDSLRRATVRTGEPAHLRIAVADVSDIGLVAVESSEHSITLSESRILALLRPVQGSCEVARGRQATRVESGQSMLVDIGERTTSVSPAYHGLQVLLPRVRLAETLAWMTQGEAPGSPGDRVLDGSRLAGAQLDAFLVRLISQLSASGGDLSSAPWAQASASQALLALLAGAVLACGSLERGRPAATAAPWQVRRAEEMLRARAHERLTIADICRELKVGARSLQLAFQRHRGMSLKRYQQDCRLELARELLRQLDHDRSVASIALACGFTHAGRFAAAYRQRYGELPLATRQRGQAGSPRPS